MDSLREKANTNLNTNNPVINEGLDTPPSPTGSNDSSETIKLVKSEGGIKYAIYKKR
jgi:hypothetical protein